jgi:hypothetical protein
MQWACTHARLLAAERRDAIVIDRVATTEQEQAR